MIHVFGSPAGPVPRLVSQLADLGHAVSRGEGKAREGATLVLGAGVELAPEALGILLGAWRSAPGARVLILSPLGTHPDARAERLRTMWQTEELVRQTAIPSLMLRLGPLVGPRSPFWIHLANRSRLPRGGRDIVQPVAEEDVVSGLDRALHGKVHWEGWYEVVGREALSLAELAEMAQAHGPLPGLAEWEPPLDELRDQRLAEPQRWEADFGIQPAPLAARAPAWAA